MGSPASDPLIGKVVGPCRIDEYLSRGGMGNVYRGRHLALDREVAIKIIEPPVVNGEAVVQAVLREARAAAKLEDPRIVQVYDVGQQGPYCYIIMQLMRGETLERMLVRRRFLNPPEALKIMREVAAALAVAHRLGIVHRDVKPGNVMIDEAGQVRIMDFGIAAPVGSDPQAAGSVDFMAPEQAYGGKPDPRTDLYAFGAMYYLMLTGKFPYPASSTNEAILKHRDAPIPCVRDADPSLTRFTSCLIARLMAKTPDERPSSADEVIKALDSPEMLMESQAARMDDGLHAGAPLPPGPPAVPLPSVSPTALSQAIFLGLVSVAFCRAWASAVQADWMAAGFASASLLLPFYLGEREGWRRKLPAAAALLCMIASFYKFGLPGSLDWVPSRAPSIEVLILLGLGAAAGAGSLWEGVFDEESRSLELALWLLALAVVSLALGGASLRLSGQGDLWWPGLKDLAVREGRSFLSSQGLWRWLGVAVLYAGSWVFFPKRKQTVQKIEGRVVGYA
ncbi:MAG: serine/threonine protein kinase [Elusimicrobia bacterium]|nr:serine/threonine protein kinase [Elusimicrobiota bacterium]